MKEDRYTITLSEDETLMLLKAIHSANIHDDREYRDKCYDFIDRLFKSLHKKINKRHKSPRCKCWSCYLKKIGEI